LQACDGVDVVQDEEISPIPGKGFDLIIGNMNLHWINQPEGPLHISYFKSSDFCSKVKASLADNGAFMGSLFGGETLFELR
jgi:hypothetical protein